MVLIWKPFSRTLPPSLSTVRLPMSIDVGALLMIQILASPGAFSVPRAGEDVALDVDVTQLDSDIRDGDRFCDPGTVCPEATLTVPTAAATSSAAVATRAAFVLMMLALVPAVLSLNSPISGEFDEIRLATLATRGIHVAAARRVAPTGRKRRLAGRRRRKIAVDVAGVSDDRRIRRL